MSDAGLPPAGWYPDPSVPGTERWWDGHGWTQQVRAAGSASTPPAPPPPPSPMGRSPSTPPAAPGGGVGARPISWDPGGASGGVRAGGGAAAGGGGAGQPPGWYADPTAPGMVRWWSGWSWVGGPRLPGEIGTTGQGLRDVGALVTDAWDPIGRRIGDLGSMAMALLLPVVLVAGPLLWLVLRDVELVETSGFGDSWQLGGNQPGFGSQQQYELVGFGVGEVVVIIVALVVLTVVYGLLWLGAARLLLGEAQGVREHWGKALRAGSGRFWRVLGTGLAIGVLLVGVFIGGGMLVAGSALIPPLLLVTIPAWLVGFLYVVFRLQLAVVAAAVAPLDVRPISASWTLVGSKLLGVIGRLLVLLLLTWAVGWVVSIPMAGLQALLPGVTGFVVSFVLQMAVSLLTTVYVLSGSILIWQDLGGAVEQVVAVSPDGPVSDDPNAR